MLRLKITVLVLLLTGIGVLAIGPTACAPNQNMMNTPQSTLPDKGNPKLDSRLNQLVMAEKRGDLAAFARQSNIELLDGEVRVIVECVPGQVEAASAAIVSTGARLELTYGNLLQVKTPVASLNALAEATSIRFIRLPQQPVPASNK